MKIYFIRHGETDWNRKRKIQGQADIPLNDTGRKQAEAAAIWLRNVMFDAIFSSPLARARETAEIIRNGRDIPVYIDERLIEIAYGSCEGMSLRLIHACPFLRLHTYFEKPQNYIPPKGGESIQELKARCRSFLEERILPMEEVYGSVMVACHGALIRAMIGVVASLSDDDFWKGKAQGNCAVTTMECRNHKIELLEEAVDTQLNDIQKRIDIRRVTIE